MEVQLQDIACVSITSYLMITYALDQCTGFYASWPKYHGLLCIIITIMQVFNISNFKFSFSDGLNKLNASCRLYVRLITEHMLHHSVTIRLNNMTSTAFLSPLFKFFVDAIALIFETDETNIFVINVMDDTDVAAQILNVSVSVRKAIEKGQEIFHSAQYLQEYIYLQRSQLAKLSTLQVS